MVPGFGVPEVRGPDFKSLSSRHAASGGSKFSKMTPPEFQRSFRLHFWQLSGHKTPNHHTLKMKSVLSGEPAARIATVPLVASTLGYHRPPLGDRSEGPGTKNPDFLGVRVFFLDFRGFEGFYWSQTIGNQFLDLGKAGQTRFSLILIQNH